jgi:hypothetical protein
MVNPNDLLDFIEKCKTLDFTQHQQCFKHLPITQGAFPEETEKELVGYLNYCQNNLHEEYLHSIVNHAAFCILSDISFTEKSGQYLRWDSRSNRPVRSGYIKNIYHNSGKQLSTN